LEKAAASEGSQAQGKKNNGVRKSNQDLEGGDSDLMHIIKQEKDEETDADQSEKKKKFMAMLGYTPAMKSEAVENLPKVKTSPSIEKSVSSSSPAGAAHTTQLKRVAAAAVPPAGSLPVSAASASSPALGRRTSGTVSPAPVTRKAAVPASSSVAGSEGIGGKRQSTPTPPAKSQEKAAAGEGVKAKSPATDSKKTAHQNLFVKPLSKASSASKSPATKSPATGQSKSGKSSAAACKAATNGKAAAKAATTGVQPLTVSLRVKKDAKERAICMVCDVGNRRNEKLIFCKNCDKIGKPSVFQFSVIKS
jgi:hypothetical protein